MRRLIINADDFGLTAGVNRAIVEAHRGGVVTSSTLMANSAAFDGAAAAAKQNPSLSVGCHIVLVDGAPLSPAASIPTLVREGSQEFRVKLVPFALAAARGKVRASEIASEAEAQIRKLKQAGITPTHFDTHKHTHIFPAVFGPLLEAARACGVRAVRNPFVPLLPMGAAHVLRRPHLWKRYGEVRVLHQYARRFRRRVAELDMVTPEGCFGVVATGALTHSLFEAIIGSIPEGTWEFVCHPGYNDGDLASARTRLRASRQQELEFLTSARARAALERHKVQLISYRDLL